MTRVTEGVGSTLNWKNYLIVAKPSIDGDFKSFETVPSISKTVTTFFPTFSQDAGQYSLN